LHQASLHLQTNMNKEIPYLKVARVAIITAPLFGLFGAAPVLGFNTMELNTVITRFFVITSVALVIWGVNVGLLSLSNRLNFTGKDWLRYIASAVACIFIFILASQLIPIKRPEMPPELAKMFPRDFPIKGPKPLRILMPLIQAMSINLVIIVLLEIMLLQDRKRKIEEENTKLRMFNLEAKHSQLKQQLHPHFLFNSLSTLRSLIKRSPEEAELYLEKLSEILRFSINSNSQTLVALREELELTTNYLNMQQVRFGSALNFTIEVPPEMKINGKVPVYSIQLLVENAIKHNILTTTQPLHIVIKGDKENKAVVIENNLQTKLHIEEGSGVGLPNLVERYRLLNTEEIKIVKTNDRFIVTIKVMENESSNS
jgi:two-component system, LytTR family, sensor kinase